MNSSIHRAFRITDCLVRTLSSIVAILVGATAIAAPNVALADAIDDLPPGHWYRVPNSKLRSVVPSTSPGGNTGFESIMIAWSGGTFDTNRDRLVVWGGGHADYAGNELYVFDLNTLAWSRLTDPSQPSGGSVDSGVYGDGRPRSTHTYNALSFSPDTGKFYYMGMGSVWSSGKGVHHSGSFNFDTNDWETIAQKPSIGKPDAMVTGYDSLTGLIWTHAGSERVMMSYDPAADSWTTYDAWPGWPPLDLYATGAVSANDRQMVAVGSGQFLVWNLENPSSMQEPTIEGPSHIINSNAPGFVYDTATGQYVGWSDSATVYTLDPQTLQWAAVTPAASNTVVPTDHTRWGTYGRFQYSPNRNVFVLVNDIDEDVFIYRLSAGGGTAEPQPTPPPGPEPEPPPSGDGSTSSTSFQELCAGAGVTKCVSFDAQGEVNADLIPDSSDSIFPEVDTTVSASGAGSLKYVIPSNSNGNSSGAYLSDLGDGFGQNESFYVAFKQRFSPEMVDTNFGGAGWKQIILHSAGSSCAAVELTTQNIYHRGFPQLYSRCGADSLREDLGNGDYLLQQGDYECHYQDINSTDCSMYKPNQWITFYYEIHIGDWGQPNTEVNAYIAYEGQDLEQYVDINDHELRYNDSPSNTFARVQLTPYNTNKSSSETRPIAYTWYDDLIISSQPIYDVSAVSIKPLPPSQLTTIQ